ncbi:uncharacterized protein B0H18DRAFT_1121565 [Fomitopsis serialis]|uniref:uncharacterized protein n=1 Tax=Fomitopsis serialis TaxID=139415 RepID=UPI0020073E24|nr:uncharacterized protein B0H18DRAFT_1121565 [Neoantrodia serialis]KAH9921156.1 hypothetical protein B0H18DRAFT_1121565 [Neoantrodia serialis]
MYIFSGGFLKYNLHRVVPALVGTQVVLCAGPLQCSRVLATLLSFAPSSKRAPWLRAVADVPDKSVFGSDQTSKEWFARRIEYQRTKNQKGPETWRQSRGTEHCPDAA